MRRCFVHRFVFVKRLLPRTAVAGLPIDRVRISPAGRIPAVRILRETALLVGWLASIAGFCTGAADAQEAASAPGTRAAEIVSAAAISIGPVTAVTTAGDGIATMYWHTGGTVDGQIYVSEDGGPEVLFASGTGASVEVPWIKFEHTYVFRLYAGDLHGNTLAETTLTVGNPGNLPVRVAAGPGESPRGRADRDSRAWRVARWGGSAGLAVFLLIVMVGRWKKSSPMREGAVPAVASDSPPWWLLFARSLCAVLVGYILMLFVFLPGNTLLSFPFHHDDYANLSTITLDFRWEPIRPISTLALRMLSATGVVAFFIGLHVLTVLYVALVLTVLLDLFDLRKPDFPLLFSVSILILSFEFLVAYTKYTGLITSLVSGLLGVGSIAILLRAFRTPDRHRIKLIVGWMLAVLSLLAKEDFMLGILLVSGWFGIMEPLMGRRKWGAASASVAVLSAALGLFFLANAQMQNPFTGSAAASYRADFSPVSLLKTILRYLTITGVAKIATAMQVGSLIVAAVFWRRAQWPACLVSLGITIALVMPYSCLPNHIFQFYALNWIPWQIASAILGMAVVLGKPRLAYRVAWQAGLLAIAALVAWGTYSPRACVTEWHLRNAEINQRIVQTVIANEEALRGQEVVGVMGIPLLCPWLSHDGRFLANRCNADHRWLVFVPEDSEHYALIKSRHLEKCGRVETRDDRDVELFPGIPLLSFKPDGTGTLTWIGSEQPAATRPVAAPSRGGATIAISPLALVDAAGCGVATLTWNTGGDIDGEVSVTHADEPEKLVGAGLSGNLDIPWIQIGHSYVFRLRTVAPPRKVLAEIAFVMQKPGEALKILPTSAGAAAPPVIPRQ